MTIRAFNLPRRSFKITKDALFTKIVHQNSTMCIQIHISWIQLNGKIFKHGSMLVLQRKWTPTQTDVGQWATRTANGWLTASRTATTTSFWPSNSVSTPTQLEVSSECGWRRHDSRPSPEAALGTRKWTRKWPRRCDGWRGRTLLRPWLGYKISWRRIFPTSRESTLQL